MPDTRFHVAGIGNAIVDVLVHAEDSLLERLGVVKGVMTLIDAGQAEGIYAKLPPGIECSGGSAANTVVGVASLGGRAAYLGKVKADQLGEVFRHDIKNAGVDFATPSATEGTSTARCFVLVSPDAQRTMLTYLGACVEFTPADVDQAVIAAAAVTYLEGYLYDPPLAKRAFLAASDYAHQAGRLVALSLSDPFCVDRHLGDFQHLVAGHVDLLFANEAELMALTRAPDFDTAVRDVRGQCRIAAITRGAQGSVVVTSDETIVVGADPIDHVVDTTGAGDLYAAGFLAGFTQNRDLATCASLGGMAAAEIISHIGARPECRLADLARERFGAVDSLS
jgi:sugar/nucleoside kinase (ribokinase family)